MDPALVAAEAPAKPSVVLPTFEGPLDLLLHLVRENRVSVWDIPIVKVCDQFHEMLRRMEELDLEIAGEYLVYAAWLLAIKSRLLLPVQEQEKDPRLELVERLVEYEKVKHAAAALAGLEEVRRGMFVATLASPAPIEEAIDLEAVDLLVLARALAAVMERYHREHPPAMELEPLRFTVQEKMLALFELLQDQKAFPLLSYVLTRPSRLESVTWLLAGLELVRLKVASVQQIQPFTEIFVVATGNPLPAEALQDA